MYIPKLYRQEDRQEILAFLKRNDFPALVTYDGRRPLATHLPVEVVEEDDGLIIYGHMSRLNPQWRTVGGQSTLFLFPALFRYWWTIVSSQCVWATVYKVSDVS